MVKIESQGDDAVRLIGLHTYSTTEIDTGLKWTDDKAIYRKVIKFGSLPNNDTKTVGHGISAIDTVVSLRGFAKSGTDRIPLPHPRSDYDDRYFTLYANATTVNVVTGLDQTGYSAYIIIEYTKN